MDSHRAENVRPDAVNQLVVLLASEHDFTSIEIAETLWLSMKIEVVAAITTTTIVVEEAEVEAQLTSSTSAPFVESESTPPPSELTPEPTPQLTPRASLTLPAPQPGLLSSKMLPVWVADPPMLTDSLGIIRALKPLLQKVNVGAGKQLDEVATVEATARTRLCVPILAPDQRSYFDLVVVVDRGPSMHIWQRLAKDIVRILKRYGVFWNVQVFDLIANRESGSTDDPVMLISNPQRPGHRPSELIDQQGQRIVIVLSDCAAPYWWDGTLLPLLQSWGAIMPTVVWQMLPAWMWKRTALGRGTAAAFSNDLYGAANQRLTVRLQGREKWVAGDRRMPLPVVTSEVRDLSRWGLMVAGDRHEVTPGFVLPHQGRAVPRSKSYEDVAKERTQLASGAASEADPEAQQQALNTLARERVERFLELASPEAQRLVMLLAAAPVITLPVVRLIRDGMLYDVPSPLPVAEVFLSGLLQRLPGQTDRDLKRVLQQSSDQTSNQSQDNLQPNNQVESEDLGQMLLELPDMVQYDFAPGVRQVLLELLPAVDTIDVINNVSAAVERRWNKASDQNFRAFLTDPTVQVAEELQGLRSFATVTADILDQLGGDYTQFAQTLRQGAETAQPSVPGGFDPSNFPLQDIKYEVAEFINFPTLEPFEFIEAHFEDDTPTFPPPLQPDEFIVITLETQAAPPQADDLDAFEFTIATLHRTGTQWQIQRQPGSAYRFVERLSEPSNPSLLKGMAQRLGFQRNVDRVELEMVAILSGTFLMGSLDDEPEHEEYEGPQHEVTVPPFFMGRYPVTQAQWRLVATIPQVNRELKTDPSRFKGANRPVEQVSWYDAVEFCARLSAHTGRQYRLPTEAEWEYACRAGTTTPFHFGETISSELASYQSGTAYADGPAGDKATKTTPIDYFGFANAFGLSDMHGNVWEWCQDHWHSNYEGAPTDGSAWLSDDNEASRVYRGGSWRYDPRNCRSASRLSYGPGFNFHNLGFRVVCSTPQVS